MVVRRQEKNADKQQIFNMIVLLNPFGPTLSKRANFPSAGVGYSTHNT
jgi:hypothetical protein